MKDVIKFAESCQMEADNMAYELIKAKKMATVQSICEFNIFWLRDISPLICQDNTVDFLYEHIEKFKRKLSAREFLMADTIISNLPVSDFDEFSRIFSAYRKNIRVFDNMKIKSKNYDYEMERF